MAIRWVYRKPHTRQLKGGRTVPVSESWYLLEAIPEKDKKAYVRRCEHCGAHVLRIAMPNGGVVHFEAGEGLWRIKHPCFHRGEHLSRRRDPETPDLFEIGLAADRK